MWEYKFIDSDNVAKAGTFKARSTEDIEAYFNALGREGWEIVALDFSGRSYLVWDAPFHRERIGDVPTELFEHFFRSFCDAAGCNLHVKTEGRNEHHKAEVTFKALGKCIQQAVRRTGHEVPSTKGVL